MIGRIRAALLGLGLLLLPGAAPADERGELIVHFLRRPVGRETWTLARQNDGGAALDAKFAYTERGTTVAADATLSLAPDLTPRAFRASGRSYRPFRVAAQVAVDGGAATVTDLDGTRKAALPQRFFTVSGYNPLSVQMMMLRYWRAHGRPARLTQLPLGSDVEIAVAGTDTVGAERLTRYSIRGIVWGRQTIWLDAKDWIAAASTYAGNLPLEAVRPDLAAALPRLLASAGHDRIAELEALARANRPLAGRFAIVGARLIDGSGGAPLDNSVVLVSGGRIEAAGPAARIAIPRGVRRIDGRGKTLLPGLWEMHAHFAQVEYGPAYLAAGVTTARDLGGEMPFATALRDSLNAGRGLGPHLILACLVDGRDRNSFGTVYADTAEEGRAVVRRCKADGFAQMKIYDYIKPAVLTAIAREAHRLGLTVTGHVPKGMTLQAAVLAGMDQINHLGSVSEAVRASSLEQVTAFLREHGTVIDPTQAWGELLGRPRDVPIASFEPGFAKAPPELAAVIGSSGSEPGSRWGLSEDTKLLLRSLARAGVPLVAGTDKALPAHSLHRELELYVAAGLTPMQVITLATSGSARVMGQDREVGTIAPGKRADMILVDGDPLADIAALRKVSAVVTNGRLYDPAPLWRSVGFRP